MKLEIKHPVLANAIKRHQENPATFEIPDNTVIQTLSRGSYVKVCAEPERFWVLITEVTDTGFEGVIDNDLVCTENHKLEYGDHIFFKAKNILSTE